MKRAFLLGWCFIAGPACAQTNAYTPVTAANLTVAGVQNLGGAR